MEPFRLSASGRNEHHIISYITFTQVQHANTGDVQLQRLSPTVLHSKKSGSPNLFSCLELGQLSVEVSRLVSGLGISVVYLLKRI